MCGEVWNYIFKLRDIKIKLFGICRIIENSDFIELVKYYLKLRVGVLFR